MRVLLFYFAELGYLGGVEEVVRTLTQGFIERGCSAGIVEIAPAWKPKRILTGGVPVWGIAAPSYTTVTRPRSWASFSRATFQFGRVVHDFKPDVVHVHYPLTQALPCVGAHSFPHNWRLVVTAHGSDIRRSPFDAPKIRSWQARLFDRCDAVTAVSRSLLDDLIALYPHAGPKAHVIYNGVTPRWFQTQGSKRLIAEKYVLFVGRLHRVKGVDILLDAWRQICTDLPGVRLWLVGEGPERESLRALAEQTGISSRVEFAGAMPQEELPALYRDAEAVVLPSRSEGMPLTLLEAGASGALFVATSIPGIPEIIEDGRTGFLSAPESPHALASAVCRALKTSPEESLRMRETLQGTIRKRFSQAVVISNYLDLFEGLRTKPGSGPRVDNV